MDAEPGTPPERYLDLHLEIRAKTRRTYVVTARSSLGHQGSADARLPEEFAAGGTRSLLAEAPQRVRALGTALFESIISGDVRSVFDRISESRGAGQGVRLVLDVPPELAALPWEILHAPNGTTFLSLLSDTPIVRRMGSLERIPPLGVAPPLRILAMVAVPGDQVQLDVGRERAWVERAITDAAPRIPIELAWVEGQTWYDLQQALDAAAYHAFHFIGHGGVNETTGEGYILLATERGASDRQTANELAGLLGDKRLRLVVLNACLGASTEGTADFSSVGATLAKAGIPAVLAMRDEISETASPLFARSFYEAVASGRQTVEEAVAAGREAINLGIEGTTEWATPVLYSRSSDGVLFTVPPERSRWATLRSRWSALPVAARVLSLLLPLVLVAVLGKLVLDRSTTCTSVVDMAEAVAGVDGCTYTSPNWKYGIDWGRPWEAVEVGSTSEFDRLTLAVREKSVPIVSLTGKRFAGNAMDCLDEMVSQRENMPNARAYEANPNLGAKDAANSWAIYSVTVDETGLGPRQLLDYLQCRTLVPNASVLQIVAMADQASEARPVTELLNNLELASIDAIVPPAPRPNDDDVQPPLSDDELQPPPSDDELQPPLSDDDVPPPPTPTPPASTGATLLASAVWGGLTAPIGPLHGDPCAFPGACAYSAGVCMPDDTHPGVDVAIEIGTPLYAPAAATVEFAGADRFYAPYHVDLRTADGDLFIFGHMWSVDPAVMVGGHVEAGQFLGTSGSPTFPGSMDPMDSGHIHFEARRANGCAFDPLPLLSGESDPTLASGLAALIRPVVRQ